MHAGKRTRASVSYKVSARGGLSNARYDASARHTAELDHRDVHFIARNAWPACEGFPAQDGELMLPFESRCDRHVGCDAAEQKKANADWNFSLAPLNLLPFRVLTVC